MKVSEILKICGDFELGAGADSRPTCKHKSKNFCACPGTTRFMCELVQAKIRKSNTPHFSMSAVDTFLACPQKYNLRYVEKVKTEREPAALFLGKRFHDCVGRIENGMEWEVGKPDGPCAVTEAQSAILEEYLLWYDANRAGLPQPTHYEVGWKLQTPKGRELIGFVDGLNADETELLERKYAGAEYDKLKERRQASLYFAAFPKAQLFRLVVYVKHDIRELKAEKGDLDKFRLRARAKIAEAGVAGNVKVAEYLRSEFPIEDEIRVVDTVADFVDLCKSQKLFPSHYFQCDQMGGCDYRQICKYGADPMAMQVAP